MDSFNISQLLEMSTTEYIRGPNSLTNYRYGTAGFRYEMEHLKFVCFRASIIAFLRAKHIKKAVGIMITASHNSYEYNGFKIVDYTGEMLSSEWEAIATDIVNSKNLIESIKFVVENYYIDLNYQSTTIIGYDTRPSSLDIIGYIKDASRCLFNNFDIRGLITTPQLHFIVKCYNDSSYGVANELGYFDKITNGFNSFIKNSNMVLPILHIDCANGVGAIKFKKLFDHIETHMVIRGLSNMILHNVNFEDHKLLNHLCGSDYIKTCHKIPESLKSFQPPFNGFSIDGDVDRIIFFNVDKENNLKILDGDYISALFAFFIVKYSILLEQYTRKFTIGVIGTAYSNGALGKFLNQLNMKVNFDTVPTGVKYLHRKALEYDIGIYFESNGHGNVLFSRNFLEILNTIKNTNQDDNIILEIIIKLESFIQLINESAGDSISLFLAVISILIDLKWSFDDWANLFQTRFSSLSKIYVDPTLFKMSYCETKVIEPKGLQEQIDQLIKSFANSRAFVRPSGTESVIRLYVESSSKNDCTNLSDRINRIVNDFFKT